VQVLASPLFRQLARLNIRAARTVGIVETPVVLPWNDVQINIQQPVSYDRLLTAAARDPEQNLPYWATIWPSGIALADAILQQPDALVQQPVLELGCGLGVTAIAALAAGADLIVTDYSPESLLLCRVNTLINIGHEPRTLWLNWRKPSAVLMSQAPFPVVLAADILYERRDVEPLLTLVEQLVAPGGLLWLAEPGRPPAQQFVAAAIAAGWRDKATQHHGPWPDPQDQGVMVNLHRLRRRG
jgi:predicted nicotinamide N-methyase